MTKKYVCCLPYLSKHTSYDCDFWYIYVKWWHLQMIFSFFQNLVRGLNGKKMAQNDKNCLSHSVSQEPYLIWLWFLVHMCKMVTSPDAFFIFSESWFGGLLGGWGGWVNGKNDKKYVWLTLYLWNRTSYDCGFSLTCVKWWFLQQFFKILIFWVFRGGECKRAKNDP